MRSFQITYLSFTIWPNIIISYIYSLNYKRTTALHSRHRKPRQSCHCPSFRLVRIPQSRKPKRRRRLQNKQWRSNKPPFLPIISISTGTRLWAAAAGSMRWRQEYHQRRRSSSMSS